MPHEEQHPHDGATDSGGKLINSAAQGYIDMEKSTAPSNPAADHSRLFLEQDQGKNYLSLRHPDGSQLRVQRDFTVLALNNTGTTINKGEAVYFGGASGGYPTLIRAKSDSGSTVPADGLMYDTTTTGNYGRVLRQGRLSDFDTSTLTAGSHFFTSATTAGALTPTRPGDPNFKDRIGLCLTSHATTGSVLVGHEPDLTAQQGQGILLGIQSGISYTKSTGNGVEQAEQSLLDLLVPSNRFGTNFTIEAYLQGVCTTVSNQPVLDFRWRVGTSVTTITNAQVCGMTTYTSNNQTNAGWELRGLFTVRTLGNPGTCIAEFSYFTEMSSQTTYAMELSSQTTTTNLNTNVDNYISVTADWGPQGTGHVLNVTNAYIRTITLGT